MDVKFLRQNKGPDREGEGRNQANRDNCVVCSAAHLWLVAGGCKTVVSLVSVGAGYRQQMR